MRSADAPGNRYIMCAFRCSFEDRQRLRAIALHRGEPYGKVLRDHIAAEFDALPIDVRFTATTKALADEAAWLAATTAAMEGA